MIQLQCHDPQEVPCLRAGPAFSALAPQSILPDLSGPPLDCDDEATSSTAVDLGK